MREKTAENLCARIFNATFNALQKCEKLLEVGEIMTTAHSTHALSLSVSLADLHSAWLESTQYDGRLRASATGHRTLHRALSNPIAGEHSQPGELPLQVRLHSRPHRPLRAMLRRVARATDAAPCAA